MLVSIMFFVFPLALFISLVVFVIFSMAGGVISSEISKSKYNDLTYTIGKPQLKEETKFKTDKIIDLDKEPVKNPSETIFMKK